jgi:hypothetical protein
LLSLINLQKQYYYYRRFISIIKFEINIIAIKKYRFDLKGKNQLLLLLLLLLTWVWHPFRDPKKLGLERGA